MTAIPQPQNSAQAVIGIDLGTSAVKCVLAQNGELRATASAALSVSSPRPGWSEQDPEAWIVAAQRAVREVLALTDISAEAIVGLGLSGQMHGAVVLDRSKKPLRPAILWNDNRAVDACAALAKACPEIGDLSGIGPLPGFTAPKLMWMRTHEPDLFSKICHVMLPKDYLALWLTGHTSTDTSDAAGTMWLDQAERAWSRTLTDASGVDIDWLPPLHNGFDNVGQIRPKIADELGLSPSTLVFAGGGDAATGALSMGAAAPGSCLMSLGTSGQLLVVDAKYSPDPDKYVHAYCHTLPNTWYRMAAMLNGARPMAWFADVLGLSVSDMLAQAEQAAPGRVPLFLPYLTGERSPHGDPHIRGGFYGLEDATGTPEMARAVVDAVAFSMADALASFGNDVTMAEPIPVIGGGSQSDLVLKTLANGLGLPVARADAGQGGAALGAALLAEVGCGMRDRDSLTFAPPLHETVVPARDPDLLDRLERYRALYQTLRPVAERL